MATIDTRDCRVVSESVRLFGSAFLHQRAAAGRWNLRTSFLPMLMLVLLLSGGSKGQDQQSAMAALNQSLKQQLVMLPMAVGRVGSGCADVPGVAAETKNLVDVARFRAAQKAGLITITEDGPGFWKVAGVGWKSDALQKMVHHRTNGCDFVLLAFTVAAKNVVAIVGLHQITGEKSAAEFTWNWQLTPAGTKLVGSLSEQERRDLDRDLVSDLASGQRDPSFNLADMTKSSSPQPAKMTLKRSGEAWLLDK